VVRVRLPASILRTPTLIRAAVSILLGQMADDHQRGHFRGRIYRLRCRAEFDSTDCWTDHFWYWWCGCDAWSILAHYLSGAVAGSTEIHRCSGVSVWHYVYPWSDCRRLFDVGNVALVFLAQSAYRWGIYGSSCDSHAEMQASGQASCDLDWTAGRARSYWFYTGCHVPRLSIAGSSIQWEGV
jgi:hypothetical protein